MFPSAPSLEEDTMLHENASIWREVFSFAVSIQVVVQDASEEMD
jgi:hypothetical protein